jgi:tRNA nucleotidyltransferase (CCA-adding enzyme)
MKPFLKQVLKSVKPGDAEEKRALRVFRDVSDELKKRLPAAIPFLGGSTAKKTRPTYNKELDVFLKFPVNTSRISEKTFKALKKFEPEIVRGSRNYFNFRLRSFGVEVIPVYDIKKFSDAKNIMDFSPLHVDYVKNNLKRPGQALLLKHFCKQNGVYGAESYRKSFSGYALELLVIHYGSFEEVMRNAKKWKKGQVINLSGKTPVLKRSQKTSLVIHDPVQPLRNASNALSHQNFSKFVRLCRAYLKKPSKQFFSDKNTLDYFKKQKKKNELFYSRKFVVKGKRDVYLSKLSKKLGKVSSELSLLGFENYFGLIPEENSFFFVVVKEIPKQVIHYGPLTSMEEHCKKFRNKWETFGFRVYKKKGRLFVKLQRSTTDGREALTKLLSSSGQ